MQRRTHIIPLIVLSACLAHSTGKGQQLSPANEVLQNACMQAKLAHKNVFLIFHASWCGWCAKMDKSIEDERCRQYFEENYIFCRVDTDETDGKKYLENPGAKELRKRFHGGEQGLPYWVILDPGGEVLGDSRMPSGQPGETTPVQNVGCPAAPAEIDYFVTLLCATSHLNAPQLRAIRDRFSENSN